MKRCPLVPGADPQPVIRGTLLGQFEEAAKGQAFPFKKCEM